MTYLKLIVLCNMSQSPQWSQGGDNCYDYVYIFLACIAATCYSVRPRHTSWEILIFFFFFFSSPSPHTLPVVLSPHYLMLQQSSCFTGHFILYQQFWCYRCTCSCLQKLWYGVGCDKQINDNHDIYSLLWDVLDLSDPVFLVLVANLLCTTLN